jgi:hypothetical protein
MAYPLTLLAYSLRHSNSMDDGNDKLFQELKQRGVLLKGLSTDLLLLLLEVNLQALCVQSSEDDVSYIPGCLLNLGQSISIYRELESPTEASQFLRNYLC